jgi:hypothetical protein
MPCKGRGCLKRGTVAHFTPLHFPTEIEGNIYCAQCGEEGMTRQDISLLTGEPCSEMSTYGIPFFTGRYDPLPMHDYLPYTSSACVNECAPYGPDMKRITGENNPRLFKYCKNCGIFHIATQKLLVSA